MSDNDKVFFFMEKAEEAFMGKYFGTDGYRGEANVGLKVEDAFKIGRFIG